MNHCTGIEQYPVILKLNEVQFMRKSVLYKSTEFAQFLFNLGGQDSVSGHNYETEQIFFSQIISGVKFEQLYIGIVQYPMIS